MTMLTVRRLSLHASYEIRMFSHLISQNNPGGLSKSDKPITQIFMHKVFQNSYHRIAVHTRLQYPERLEIATHQCSKNHRAIIRHSLTGQSNMTCYIVRQDESPTQLEVQGLVNPVLTQNIRNWKQWTIFTRNQQHLLDMQSQLIQYQERDTNLMPKRVAKRHYTVPRMVRCLLSVVLTSIMIKNIQQQTVKQVKVLNSQRVAETCQS